MANRMGPVMEGETDDETQDCEIVVTLLKTVEKAIGQYAIDRLTLARERRRGFA